MKRRRRIAVGTGAGGLAVAAVVAGVTLDGRDRAPRAAAADRSTAVVRRTTLRDQQTLSGTLGFSAGTPLVYRADPKETGPHTVTWIAPVGSVVPRGGVLFEVDQRPIRLMFGSVPSYRTLRSGMVGRDVLQLQDNLVQLGYGPITVDGDFGPATVAAVRRWQEATGAKRTGVVRLGAVVFAPGPRRIARAVLRPGAIAADGAATLQAGPPTQRIRVPLPVSDRRVARVGRSVQVTLPDQSTVHGRITAIGRIAKAGTGDDGPTVTVTIRLDRRAASRTVDRAPVSVRFTRAIRRRVLAVPVEALQGTAGGRFVVRVVRPDGQTVDRVPVTPGLIVDGLAEVRGPITGGSKVVVPDAT